MTLSRRSCSFILKSVRIYPSNTHALPQHSSILIDALRHRLAEHYLQLELLEAEREFNSEETSLAVKRLALEYRRELEHREPGSSSSGTVLSSEVRTTPAAHL